MIPAIDARIAGFPVRIEGTFFLMAAILGQGRPGGLVLAWIAVVFVSILSHELGHAFAFRAFGDTPRITLHTLGGLTHSTKALPLGKDLAASAAGSLTGLLLLGIPAYALRQAVDPLAAGDFTMWVILSDLVWVNGWWSVLNLLPILPLDGGLIARRLLLHALGPRGERAALILSIIVAFGGASVALTAELPFLVLYASFFVARDGWHLWQRRDDTNRHQIGEARELLDDGQRSRAREILEQTRAAARTAEVRHVHHRNGVKDDNRPTNLELLVRPQPSGIRAVDAVEWAKEILSATHDSRDCLQHN